MKFSIDEIKELKQKLSPEQGKVIDEGDKAFKMYINFLKSQYGCDDKVAECFVQQFLPAMRQKVEDWSKENSQSSVTELMDFAVSEIELAYRASMVVHGYGIADEVLPRMMAVIRLAVCS
jgi:hypothetical protein